MRKHIQTALALSGSLALAVGASVGADAQDGPPDSQVPARFSATLGVGESDEQTVSSFATFDASDARISGTWTETSGISSSVLTEGDGGVITVWWHDITIDNAAGSWTGHSEGFGHAADFDSDLAPDGETIFLVGDGAYQGLDATLFSSEGHGRDPSSLEGGLFEGVIFPTAWHPVAEG